MKRSSASIFASLHWIWQTVFFGLPLLYLLKISLTKYNELGLPVLRPVHINYISLFENLLFVKSLFLSIILSLSTAVLTTWIALFFVLYVWSLHNTILKRTILFVCSIVFFLGLLPKTLVISQLISENGVFPTFFRDFFSIGFYFKLYTIPGLLISYISIFCPLSILILVISRSNVPKDYEMVAIELGSSWWNLQKNIVVPLMKNGILISIILVLILLIADVTIIDIIGGSKIYTIAPLIVDYFKVDEWGHAAAASIVTLVFMALLISSLVYLFKKL